MVAVTCFAVYIYLLGSINSLVICSLISTVLQAVGLSSCLAFSFEEHSYWIVSRQSNASSSVRLVYSKQVSNSFSDYLCMVYVNYVRFR